ncbi:MAG TPA: hypothetical protein VLZ33_03035, partial [Dysgonamonadaceae bacterium]|nr:hypothetical protein [Dysgonamonadaceae bacterium]
FAIQLGADCPFFIKNRAVFASGVGDKFEDIELSLDNYFFVLVKPDISVSTKEAYEQIVPKQPEVSLKKIIKMPINEWRQKMHNDFEIPIFKKHPEIEDIKQTLYDKGAVYASMSGSGTSVFGFFEEKPEPSLIESFSNNFVWKNHT